MSKLKFTLSLLILGLAFTPVVAQNHSSQETPNTTLEERAAWFSPPQEEKVDSRMRSQWESARESNRNNFTQSQAEATYVPTKEEIDADGNLLMTFTVISPNDLTSSGDAIPGDGICDDVAGGLRCTLRAALDEANATSGTSRVTINFALPFSITPHASNAPFVISRNRVTLDGFTINSSCGDLIDGIPHFPNVQLDGSAYTGSTQDGLLITGDEVIVRALSIKNFPDRGVEVFGDDNLMECLYVGTNSDGIAAHANKEGIMISGQDNLVLNNLISGNIEEGVIVAGNGATGNIIRRNLIGTEETGITAMGNGFDGIEISGGASGNFVGIFGTEPGFGNPVIHENVLAGNGSDGLEILDADNNEAYGNYIGLNRIGSELANTVGVYIANGASGNIIGEEERTNEIGGNTLDGVQISGSGSNDNRIIGNMIGMRLNPEGSYDQFVNLGNGRHGIYLRSGASNNVIGDSYEEVGAQQVIFFSGGHGVVIEGSSTSGNVVATSLVSASVTFGVLIDNAPNNSIGEDVPSQFNAMRLNGDDGIRIQGSGAINNKVFNVKSGWYAAAQADLGNGSSGVDVRDGATGTIIGGPERICEMGANNHNGINIGTNVTGTTIQYCHIGIKSFSFGDDSQPNSGPGIITESSTSNITIRDNVISYNTGFGISLLGSNNNLTNNYIGVNNDGDVARPNNLGGIQIQGDNNEIGILASSGSARPGNGGNLISGNTSHGIVILSGGSNNEVFGNYIGVDIDGNSMPNSGDGVLVDGPSNRIGFYNLLFGSGSSGRNVISGNAGSGVHLTSGASGTKVQANYIGLAPDGDTVRPNNLGVFVDNVDGVFIGQDTPSVIFSALGNIISGNSTNGITLDTDGGTIVAGNYIGLNAAGNADRGNAQSGIWMASALDTQIGGTTITERNIICGNNLQGIGLGSASDDNIIQGNYIGTTPAGSTNLGNGYGIQLANGSISNFIGGFDPEDANVIAHNLNDGIFDGNPIVAPANHGPNFIRHNGIHSNGGLGIDIGNNGPNPPPISITSIGQSGVNLVVNYEISGASAGSIYSVELFHSTTADPSGYGEGMSFVDTEVVSTNGSGNTSNQFVVPESLIPGGFASLTLISQNRSSEFSIAVLAPNPSPLKVILAGAFDTATSEMSTALNTGGHLPLQQPYVGGIGLAPALAMLQSLLAFLAFTQTLSIGSMCNSGLTTHRDWEALRI